MVQREQPFSLRISKDSLEAYKKAAERAGLSVSEWARLILDVSAGVSTVRAVFYVDVGAMKPKEALKKIKQVERQLKGQKVREGKW